MSNTYLSLTNEVLNRMNEVELTSSSFSSARGFQIQCKNAVNDAILHVNSREYNWPFNHTTSSETLVAGTTRYTFASTLKYVDFETFRLIKDASLGASGNSLVKIDYREYLDKYIDQEDDATVQGSLPTHVFRTPDNNWGLYPYPDKAYTVKYEGYTNSTLLSAYGDTPSIPDQYRTVIIDGATAYAYLYRGEKEQYALNWDRFEKGITEMQSILINRSTYMRSTMIARRGRSTHYSDI